jgi:RND family efflux transporter MFP subunit
MRPVPILTTILVAAAACTGSGATPPPESRFRRVQVSPIIDTTVREPVVAAGTLAAKDEPVLGFKIGGVVRRLTVDEGDRVRAGQVLASLALPEVDAAVGRAAAALEKAERDLARLERLTRDSVATAVQAQDARTARDVALADLSSARFNRTHAVITAPAAGTVIRRHVREGEVVASGAPIITLASSARGVVFRVDLADRDVLRVRLGDTARVRLDAIPGRVFAGIVSEIGAAPAAGLGTYRVEIAIPAATGLPSGLVGRAELEVGNATRTVLLPVESLIEADGPVGTVFVIDTEALGADSVVRVSRRKVTVTSLRGGTVGVSAGLDGARLVVTAGAPWLTDSMLVKVIP